MRWPSKVRSGTRKHLGKFFTQASLYLTKCQKKICILSSVFLNLFYSKHGFGNVGNADEGVCDSLLLFPLDVPPVQLGPLIHSVFEKLCSVCSSCYCMCLVWCRARLDIKRPRTHEAARSCCEHNTEAGSLSASRVKSHVGCAKFTHTLPTILMLNH